MNKLESAQEKRPPKIKKTNKQTKKKNDSLIPATID